MKAISHLWFIPVAILVLAPSGIRVLTWPAPRRHVADTGFVETGRKLFVHEWTANDPLANGGDGLGPVFNAKSCVACHEQGGVGGAGGLSHNVTTFVVQPRKTSDKLTGVVTTVKGREGVIHAHALTPQFKETLSHIDSSLPQESQPSLDKLVAPHQNRGEAPARFFLSSAAPPVERPRHNGRRLHMPPGVHVSQRNTPALFGAKLIDEIPDRVIIAQERSQRLKWGLLPADSESVPVGRASRLPDGRVGHFGWKAQSASLSDFVQAACANELGLGNPGQAQPKPLGKPTYQPPGLDLTLEQCNQLTEFIAFLPRPTERFAEDSAKQEEVSAGKALFHKAGCADCHTPNLGSVEGLYSDLLLHRMGQELEGGGSYNDPAPQRLPDIPSEDSTHPGEWRTPPLWGVADSAPYLHDGRAATLSEAIALHTGQGARAATAFTKMSPFEQTQLVEFLQTLRAPSDETRERRSGFE